MSCTNQTEKTVLLKELTAWQVDSGIKRDLSHCILMGVRRECCVFGIKLMSEFSFKELIGLQTGIGKKRRHYRGQKKMIKDFMYVFVG